MYKARSIALTCSLAHRTSSHEFKIRNLPSPTDSGNVAKNSVTPSQNRYLLQNTITKQRRKEDYGKKSTRRA